MLQEIKIEWLRKMKENYFVRRRKIVINNWKIANFLQKNKVETWTWECHVIYFIFALKENWEIFLLLHTTKKSIAMLCILVSENFPSFFAIHKNLKYVTEKKRRINIHLHNENSQYVKTFWEERKTDFFMLNGPVRWQVLLTL